MAENNEDRNIFDKYHLSTEGYYFMYRKDKNDNKIWRATLYRTSNNEKVDDVRVSTHELGVKEKSHHDVINHFEARITLNQIK